MGEAPEKKRIDVVVYHYKAIQTLFTSDLAMLDYWRL